MPNRPKLTDDERTLRRMSTISQRGLLRLATSRPCSLKAGRDHTINGERVHVTAVNHTTLGAITHDEARLLGHKGTAAFKRAWVLDRDVAWLDAADRTDAEVLDRFTTRWAHRAAWFVRYQPAEQPRFLATQHDILRGGDQYTANRARSIDPEAEVIDEATQARYSKDALGFCIGRQLNRQREEKAKRDTRARQFRSAA